MDCMQAYEVFPEKDELELFWKKNHIFKLQIQYISSNIHKWLLNAFMEEETGNDFTKNTMRGKYILIYLMMEPVKVSHIFMVSQICLLIIANALWPWCNLET